MTCVGVGTRCDAVCMACVGVVYDVCGSEYKVRVGVHDVCMGTCMTCGSMTCVWECASFVCVGVCMAFILCVCV